jgi:hypothetical protein
VSTLLQLTKYIILRYANITGYYYTGKRMIEKTGDTIRLRAIFETAVPVFGRSTITGTLNNKTAMKTSAVTTYMTDNTCPLSLAG